MPLLVINHEFKYYLINSTRFIVFGDLTDKTLLLSSLSAQAVAYLQLPYTYPEFFSKVSLKNHSQDLVINDVNS